MPERPLILVTNDDGYGTPGLEAMVGALSRGAKVVVIAPEQEQSACSHKFTLRQPLRLYRVEEGRFRIDGTPADCVYIGVYGVGRWLPRVPDLVVSGLNAGLNLGLDTYYSGTVAAAREAAMRGLPGLAVSTEAHANLDRVADVCANIAFRILAVLGDRRPPLVLNVNVPARGTWGVRRTRLGRRTYGEGVEVRRDPRGREYVWLGGPGAVHDDLEPGTDTHAIDVGAIGMTHLPLAPEDGTETIVDEIMRAIVLDEDQGRGS